MELIYNSLPEFSVEGNKIAGYATRFNVMSREKMAGGVVFHDILTPTMFDAWIRNGINPNGTDLVATVDHSMSVKDIYARTGNGTLNIRADQNGLYHETTGDSEYYNSLTAKIKEGLINQMSFGMYSSPGDYKIERKDDDTVIRTFYSVSHILDVSLVSQGAFPGTSVELNCDWIKEIPKKRNQVSFSNLKAKIAWLRHK